MFRYKYIKVTVDAGKEKVEAIITSTETEPKLIHFANFEKTTDVDFLAWIEREKIVDIPTLSLPAQIIGLPLEIDLPVGETFFVGFRNATAATITYWVSIQYEIKPP